MISTVLYVTYVICKRLAIFITSATSTGFPKSNLKSIFWYTHAKLLQIPCPQQREIARDMEKKKRKNISCSVSVFCEEMLFCVVCGHHCWLTKLKGVGERKEFSFRGLMDKSKDEWGKQRYAVFTPHFIFSICNFRYKNYIMFPKTPTVNNTVIFTVLKCNHEDLWSFQSLLHYVLYQVERRTDCRVVFYAVFSCL